MWQLKNKKQHETWGENSLKHICGVQGKADMTQLLNVTELRFHFGFFPSARHWIH